MPTLPVRGVDLALDLSADSGPLVVQLHGLLSSRVRDEQMGLDLGKVLHGHRVLRYDARGHGESSGSWNERDYTWNALAEDLLTLLDIVAPGEKVHGVGPSMGTGTLLHAAARDPERFTTLTLITPPTAWGTRPAQAAVYRANAALVEKAGLEAYLELGADGPVPPALMAAPATRPAVTADLLPTVLRGAAISDLPPKDVVRGLDVPVLILAWTKDYGHPLKTARTLHTLIEDSRLVTARNPYGVVAWPGLFAEHITMDRDG